MEVSAPAVILRVVDDACTNGIEVDVGGDGVEGVGASFDEDGAIAIFPEGAAAFVGAIEPLGEALFEDFHEGADVPHAGEPAFAEGFSGVMVFDGSEVVELESEFVGDGVSEVLADVGDELVVVREEVRFGAFGDFHEDVEVVGHDAEREDAQVVEGFVGAHEMDEFVLFGVVEEKVAIHDAGNAVVECGGEVGRGFEAWAAHGWRVSR